MNPDDQSNKIDADSLGRVAESKKEAMVEATEASFADAEKQKAKRQQKKARKVGIKTYRDYAAEELKKGGGTLTKMIVQERDREREQKRHSPKNTKNILVTALAILFVLAGAGVVVLSFFLVSQKQDEITEKNSFVVNAQPLIISDFRKEIYIDDPTLAKLTRAVDAEVESTTIPVGSIKHVYFVQDGEDVPKELVTAGGLLRDLNTQAPSALLRTFDADFMYGFYSSTEVSPFLLFKVGSFNTAYAGMLEWERTIIQDVDNLFTQDLSDTNRSVFEDIVLYNTDVRVLLDEQGEVIFGYGFLQDKTSLVIFDNRLTLREVITRTQQNTIKQ